MWTSRWMKRAALASVLWMGGAPAAQAEPSWVEAKLISVDELEILYGAAAQMIQAGKPEQARILILGSSDAVREALQRATLPKVRAQLMAYEQLKPKAWEGVSFDAAAFPAKMEVAAPELQAMAEKVALPPAGARFDSPRDRVQRVLQAKAEMENAAALIKAYAADAPPVEVHLEAEGSKAVTAPLRVMVFGAIALADHVKLATEVAKKEVAALSTKTDEAVAAESLGTISQFALQELEYAKYLVDLGEKELGERHQQHAEDAIAKETKLREAMIAANRLPKSSYAGDRSKLEAEVRTQFARAYPKDTILEVRLSGADFTVQRQWVKQNDGSWAWKKIRRYEWAHVAYQTPSMPKTQCKTMPLRVEQQWTGGGWSPMYTYKPLEIYGFTMLAENVKK